MATQTQKNFNEKLKARMEGPYYSSKVWNTLGTQKEEAATYLERCADVLDETGWVKGHAGFKGRAHCAVGTLQEFPELVNTPLAAIIGAAMDAEVPEMKHSDGTYFVTEWNDKVAKSKRQVQLLMRRAAKHLRNFNAEGLDK